MTATLAAIDPQKSATVSASAGTGKTWLLVSRIIRLLLDGARPDAILAITFTRKAAAEMQTRLADRLFQFAAADDAELTALLEQIQAPGDAGTLAAARELYETILHSSQKVRASTFHSFCQDILRRFPLDAGIAPGFELVENTADLSKEAWDAIVREATLNPDGTLASQLETLMDYCNGLANTQSALNSFLQHRSDWWAFTEQQESPVDFATNKLIEDLQVDPTGNPYGPIINEHFNNELKEFVDLLAKHPTNTNQSFVAVAQLAFDSILESNYEVAFNDICEIFLTKDGKPRSRKESATLAKKLGHDGQTRFLQLHERISSLLMDINDYCYRLNLYEVCCAWYHIGQYLLERFQLIKAEQRILDFSDLEWKTYSLLTQQENAHWVQYKLDQRIDHLLIDEFQDTNPTQWQLIVPLLDELAAGNLERQRSVFFVGDHKQSIYRFRRAAPELFDTAQQWLEKSLAAVNQPLSISWRSAPAIIQCVNWVFADGPLSPYLHQFSTHDTHHKQLWGRVEVLPLVPAGNQTNAVENEHAVLRNPLLQPRTDKEDTRHYNEGKFIAEKIQSVITNATAVESEGKSRPVSYSDIMILLRHRTHAKSYEKALREAHIPYIGAERGTLLDTLEVQDMLALLETLVTPYNNLAVATVLRSPIFACSDQQLILIAELKQGTWLQRLQVIADSHQEQQLHTAYNLLSRWSNMAGVLPVHDLLDRIYNEGNILNRYEAAYPNHLKQRVRGNLTRFIELGLEVDSGRYPSIGNFLSRLKTLQQQEQQGPDETSAAGAEPRVQIMTIHASKGMESPVVFLADATNTLSVPKAYQTIVDWPATAKNPNHFILTPPKKHLDSIVEKILLRNNEGELKEEANLLYVALTRAKQMLFISGCEPNRGTNLGWYGKIRDQLQHHMHLENQDSNEAIILEIGEAPPLKRKTEKQTVSENHITDLDPNLKGPFSHIEQLSEIAPSYAYAPAITPAFSQPPGQTNTITTDEDSLTRGNVIHRILYLQCEGFIEADITQKILNEYGVDLKHEDYMPWLVQAKDVINNTAHRFLFEPSQYKRAYNEAPIVYQKNNATVYGFIDRLIITDEKIIIVDYKTHALQNENDMEILKTRYTPQLFLYKQGVEKCWPGVPVECYLLFTSGNCLGML